MQAQVEEFFFSGSSEVKLDEKNRFVLPQSMRYGLVENGKLEFTIALGLGGCLAIYKRSDIDKMVKKFQKRLNDAKFQKFFTIFFSTLHHTTCDKVGRIVLPPLLKRAVGIESEIVVAGVMNKIELWPKEKYQSDLEAFIGGGGEDPHKLLSSLLNEAFALLDETENEAAEDKSNTLPEPCTYLGE